MPNNTEEQNQLKNRVKWNVSNYLNQQLKYCGIKKEDFKTEENKIHNALRDLFLVVPLEEMSNYDRFCENGRFDFLLRKVRKHWGEKILLGIYTVINEYLTTH